MGQDRRAKQALRHASDWLMFGFVENSLLGYLMIYIDKSTTISIGKSLR